ncbi:MAG TPA: tyrosine-type recombinase/integrase [Clostridium sp.]
MAEISIAEKLPTVTDEQWNKLNKFNRNITEEFLLESTNLSPKTLRQYLSALHIFFFWVYEHCDDKSLLEIKSRDFLKYQNFLVRRGMSSSGVRLKRAAISSLNGYIITFYEEEYPTFKNFITKKISAPPINDLHIKQPMNAEEWELLLKDLETRKQWQKLAYLKFTYSTACRRAESRQLLKEVVDYPPIIKEKKIKNDDGIEEIKTITFYATQDTRCKGKGVIGEVRKLKFDQSAMDAISKWLEVRGEDDCPYVFVTKSQGEYRQAGEGLFNDWCKDDFSKVINRRVHPHQLREQRATWLVVNEGKDIKSAQALLGHKSSTTTEIYIIRDGSEDVEEAFI